MTNFVNQIKTQAQKRAAYRRTMAELRTMPIETMIDLDIAPNEFDPDRPRRGVRGMSPEPGAETFGNI